MKESLKNKCQAMLDSLNNDEIFELADSLSDCEGDISEFELMVYAEYDKCFGPHT